MNELIVHFGIAVLLFAVQAQIVPVLIWLERRGAGFIQDRLGPNRVGPLGLFQPLADALKLLFKQDVVPTQVHTLFFLIAPAVVVGLAAMSVATIPFGDTFTLMGQTYVLQVADVPVGLLYLLAIGSFSVYGIMLGGWASSNKYALFGAMRASAQMISYELGLGIGMASIVLLYSTFDIRDIVLAQQAGLLSWGIIQAPWIFVLLLVTIFAETNRLPFDLAEGEAEIVGFHVEYSSMKFALFFMAEYMHMFVGSVLLVAFFFGGWALPGVSYVNLTSWLQSFIGGSFEIASVLTVLLQLGVVIAKTFVILWIFIWVRWSFPRFRYDQLMRFGWQGVLPYAILSFVLTAACVYVKG